ncbi:MAG: class I SAM-dependent rRNA methyltransferase [Pirellulales bacterium]|nr:class I SAM-dependent rRNA methyltransferase [Pirellulales bacterium]
MDSVVLKPRKAAPFFGRHPWVLDSAIARLDGTPADGDAVDLVTDQGKWIARGLFNSRSRIRVRLYTWDVQESLDESFWRRRLSTAIAWRRRLGYDAPEGAARLVFSEADGLSGLVVDRFANYLSIQVTSLGIASRLDTLAPILAELTGAQAAVVRSEKGVAKLEGLEYMDRTLFGTTPSGPIFITENGLRYGVDLTEGQKTGFYVDQRENRLAAARYLSGRRVLDAFCYSGGFSLAAVVHGGATETLGIDASEKAIALARANAELNGVSKSQFLAGDGFDTLANLCAEGRRFGGVILDPPKFARSRGTVNDALRAYHRLNRLAVGMLEPGGILVTCSCSGHVTREDFLYMLAGVAQKSERDIQILEQRGAAPDHPTSATCLETEYLKCFICRVV